MEGYALVYPLRDRWNSGAKVRCLRNVLVSTNFCANRVTLHKSLSELQTSKFFPYTYKSTFWECDAFTVGDRSQLAR
jgi:hypothetical protein